MNRRIFGLGETILDIIFQGNQVKEAKPGGSAFNTLISLGRLQQEAYLISEFGTDDSGSLIKDFMQSNGVRTDFVHQFEGGYKTPISIAHIQANGDASYNFYKDYPTQRLTKQHPDFQEGDLLVFGSYYALNPALRIQVKEILQAAKQAGAFILYDPNFRKTHNHERAELLDAIKWNLEIADLVRASDEDLSNIFQCNDLEAQKSCLRNHCQHFVITANRAGIHLQTGPQQLFVESDNIQPVSTIGAGDSFNAGLLYSFVSENIYSKNLAETELQTWQKILTTAKYFATQCCLSWDNYIPVPQHK